MRILLISPTPPPNGGIATWTIKYLDFFKNTDHTIDLVNTSIIGDRGKNLDKKNIRDEFTRLKKIISSIKYFLKVNKYDVVHINTSCSKTGMIRDFQLIKIIKKKNIPVILQCHCNIEDQIKSNRYSEKMLKKICLLSDKILVLNNKSFYYLKKQKIKSIIFPNFIDDEVILKGHKRISKRIGNVVFVGHVIETKGVNELIEASKELTDINFTFVGEMHTEYKNKVYPKNIHFVGNIDHMKVIEYLDKSDLFIMPSYTEGFSVAVLEAMARGLPIVTTDVGNNKELLGNNGGLIIEKKNTNQIVEAINIMMDPKLRKEMSENNVLVAKSYTRSFVINSLIKLYLEGFD